MGKLSHLRLLCLLCLLCFLCPPARTRRVFVLLLTTASDAAHHRRMPMNARIWLAAPILALAVGAVQHHASRALAADPAAAGGQDTSTLDDQSELSLTVYNSDLA